MQHETELFIIRSDQTHRLEEGPQHDPMVTGRDDVSGGGAMSMRYHHK